VRLALYDLTPREREVARLLVRGETNDEIARALCISRYTVKDHAKSVYAKLGVASRTELSPIPAAQDHRATHNRRDIPPHFRALNNTRRNLGTG
jgi:DNA-binding CsgD family transcriptional regulator